MAFNLEFEEQLLSRLIRDKKFFFTYQSVLSENHFDSQIYRDLYEVACEYHPKYNSDLLTREILKNEINKKLELSRRKDGEEVFKERLELYFDTIDRIYTADLSSGEQYTADAVVKFAKRQAQKKLLLDGADELERGGSLEGLGDKFKEIEKRGVEPEASKWGTGKTLIEILDAPIIPSNYLVEPILSAGDKGFLVAQYKKGKTLLMMDLTLSLAMGRDWLGFKVPKPRKVLYVRFELKDSRFNERLRLMVGGMGNREKIQSIPIFEYPRGFEITNQADFDWLKMMIDTNEPEALLLDPFYKLTSKLDIKDPKNAMPLLRKFEELRGAYQELLMLLSHHDKKLSGTESDWDSTYGPMFFFADMDFEMKLNGGNGKFTLSFLSNDVPVENIKIERDPETLVHRFTGTESQDLRKEVMNILKDEGSLPKSSTIEGVATIESVLKGKNVKFNSGKLEDELIVGMKEGLYKMKRITLTKKDGRTHRVKGYELGI